MWWGRSRGSWFHRKTSGEEAMHSPIDVFKTVWCGAKKEGTLKHRNAVCVSTVDVDGYPSSRFVDLKEVDEAGFVFCTCLDSAKALEISLNPKAGITIWWEHVAMQIRIQGECSVISHQEADKHWLSRSREAQITTATFNQSKSIASLDSLVEQYSQAEIEYGGKAISRPHNWGGFRLKPKQIEFLEFKESRLHLRTVYRLADSLWQKSFLQP
ncbi:MAG: pyridoxal 5'-phosphate synthase [Steroidobacteraceae bacterium]